jgi:pimeloyl-ACP methyl ester carboxylesterase
LREEYVHVDGNKIRYLESGNSDDAMVLIHGLGASADRWEYVIPLFTENFHVIVPDLIGFGYSDKPLVDYTPAFFADFLKKFLKTMSIKKPVLIGSSLGGQVIIEFTAKNNELVKKLVLVSPSGAMRHSTPALDAYIMAALYPNEDGAKTAFEMMTGSARKIDRKIIRGFVERMQLPNAKMAFMSTLLGLKNSDAVTNKLRFISVPTLIVWGQKDPVIPINYADAFVSSIKDCRFYRMDGSGHTPYVDDPKSFAKIVTNFIKG